MRRFIRKNPYTFVFGLLSLFMFGVTILFITQALTSEHMNYSFRMIGYGGTFNQRGMGTDRWPISPYWVMQLLGIAGMSVLCTLRRKEVEIRVWQAVLTGILLAIFGFIGAKLLYILENVEKVLDHGLDLGGVSFFGTVFFMPLAIPLIRRILRIKSGDYTDFCTPAGLLMLAFIRIGCFLKGCCHGITIWVDGKPFTYPVQLIECMLDLALLSILLSEKVRNRFRGYLYVLFMGGYGLIRFVLEFFRDTNKDRNLITDLTGWTFGEENSFGPHISDGQMFSVLCILIAVLILLLRGRRKKDNPD